MQGIILLFLIFLFTGAVLPGAVQEGLNNDGPGSEDTLSIRPLDVLNSDYRETNPRITPDGRYLFFMSGRGGNAWNQDGYTHFRGKKEADGDIYYSLRDDEGQWTTPVNLGRPVNTPMGEDEPNVSPDGQHVVFQSWKEGWDTSGGPYYRSELSGNDWSRPVGIGGEIHRFFMDMINLNDGFYATDGSSLSPDGKIFIFAAGKWYDEPMDLFISIRKNGQWTYPARMALNTKADERSAFLAADSRTLFFSSAGYGGSGGLDIFKTILDEDGMPGPVINLGIMFNTEGDDAGFSMNAEGTEIFFSRDADLYQGILSHPAKVLQTMPVLLVNGVVMNYEGEPIEAEVRIRNARDGEMVARAKSNALSGEYGLVIRKTGKRYVKEIQAENYKPDVEPIKIAGLDSIARLQYRDYLKRINTELIFFDFDDPFVRESETGKLDSITGWLYKDKRSKVLLTGHADQPGGENYNLELSRKRVENVKEYFERKGVPAKIMRTEYRGESQPLESHPRGEENEVNRRVEVRIILDDDH